MKHLWKLAVALCAMATTALCAPAETQADDRANTRSASSPYRLGPGDRVRVVVFDEPDLTVEQRIDDLGEVRLALHGPLRLAGLSPRDAERRIEQAYIEARLLRAPQATLSILDYRLRTALALGQVRSAGNVAFPAGTESVDIVEFITLAGGFTETARTGNVQVFRARPDGTEQAFTVDVGALLDKRRSEENRGGFQVLPGDRVLISQRVF